MFRSLLSLYPLMIIARRNCRSSLMFIRTDTSSLLCNPILPSYRLLSLSFPERQQRFFSSSNERNTIFSSKTDQSSTSISSGALSSFKAMWKKYGFIAIGTYFGIYVCTLGSIFFILDFDILNASSVGWDPAETIKKVCDLVTTVTGSEALPGYIKKYPTIGTFAIAWAMTKFTEPLRLGVTIAIVPKIARVLGKKVDETR